MGDLLSISKKSRKLVQVYFMVGNQAEAQQRWTNFYGGLELNIVMELSEIFHLHHKYVTRTNKKKIIIRADKPFAAEHEMSYNAPVIDEIANIMVDEQQDIILQLTNGHLQHISEIHRAYDSL